MPGRIEKRNGPGFRKRWHPTNRDWRRIRAMRRGPFLLGTGKVCPREPSLAETFASLHERRMDDRPRAGALRRKVRHSTSVLLMLVDLRRRMKARRAQDSDRPTEDLFMDLLESDEVKTFVRERKEHGRELYSALAFVVWEKNGVEWDADYHVAGWVVAELRNQYEWTRDFWDWRTVATVSPRMAEMLGRLGWTVKRIER